MNGGENVPSNTGLGEASVRDSTPTRMHATPRLKEPGRIERSEDAEPDDAVRYESVMLLAPGEWTDSASRETVYYAPDAIKRSADNWQDNQVNLHHDPQNPTANVGHVDTDSVTVDDRGRLFADIVLHGRTAASEDAIGLFDLALESEGDQGIGGPSVEIPDDVVEWDSDRGVQRMVEMAFSGLGLVMTPASKPVSIAEQTAQRGVAMSAATEHGPMRLMLREADADDATESTHELDSMENDLQKRLDGVRGSLTEAARALQNPSDMALNALDEYLSADGTGEGDDLAAFESWADENLDDTLAAAVSEMVSAFDDAADAEGATVADLREWAASATDDEAPDDGEAEAEASEGELADEDDDPDDDGDGDGDGDREEAVMADAVTEEVVGTLESVAATVEDVAATVEQQTAAMNEAMERVDSLGARLEDVEAANEEREKRLETLEDNPNPRTLTAGGSGDSDSEETSEKPSGGFVRDRGYIGR